MSWKLSNTKTALRQSAKSASDTFKNILQKNNKKATGSTIGSIKGEIFIEINSVGFRIFANKTYTFIDKGRRPNAPQPPLKPILAWMKAKRITTKRSSRNSLTMEQLAFIISKDIGIHGIKKLDVTKKAKSQFQKNLRSKIKYAFKKDIQEQHKQEINKIKLNHSSN